MDQTLLARMHDELSQAHKEWYQVWSAQTQWVWSNKQQWDRFYPAFLGERGLENLTADELRLVTARLRSLRSRTELQKFLDAQEKAEHDRAYVPAPAFAWSEHTRHILTLFRPWRPEDGYAEEVIPEGRNSPRSSFS